MSEDGGLRINFFCPLAPDLGAMLTNSLRMSRQLADTQADSGDLWTATSKPIWARDADCPVNRVLASDITGKCVLAVRSKKTEGRAVCLFRGPPSACSTSTQGMAGRWNKRKRDDWDDEDAGDERIGAQVLPVARSLPSDSVPS
jgi:hypothetical protein